MENIKRIIAVLCAISLLFCLAGCGESENESTPSDASSEVKGVGTHHAVITVKDFGEIKLELYGDTAPITVQNFMDLANAKFYDGLTFHRIDPGFVIQGGDPEGTGLGGSEKEIKGEFAANGVKNTIPHLRGVISMARKSYPYDSASSQFFIVHQDHQDLDGLYAAFGKVTEGMEIVDEIVEKTPVANAASGAVLKENQPIIESIRITD